MKGNKLVCFMLAVFVLISMLACFSDIEVSTNQEKDIAVASYFDTMLFRQFALGFIDKAEKLGYFNVKIITSQDDDFAGFEKNLQEWVRSAQSEEPILCLMAYDDATASIARQYIDKGINIILAHSNLIDDNSGFVKVLREEDVAEGIDCYITYDESPLFNDVAEEIARLCDGRDGAVTVIHGRLTNSYNSEYYIDAFKDALNKTGCDISNIEFIRFYVDKQDDFVYWKWADLEHNALDMKDLKYLKNNSIATFSIGAESTEFANEHFVNSYNVAVGELSLEYIEYYDTGNINSLYYYPSYEEGRASAIACDKLFNGELDSNLNYIPIGKYSGDKQSLEYIKDCENNKFFTIYGEIYQ